MKKNRMKVILSASMAFLAAYISIHANAAQHVGASEKVEKGMALQPVFVSQRKTAPKTGSHVFFGNYWQKDTNGDGKADELDEKTPIEWSVLWSSDSQVMLLAEKCLDSRTFHDSEEKVTWETCDLRNWLNKTFINSAFTEEEQRGIVLKEISTENEVFAENGNYTGETSTITTMDKIFLPSVEDMTNDSYGFNGSYQYEDGARVASNTAYCASKDNRYAAGENDSYWLRNSGQGYDKARAVHITGSIGYQSPVTFVGHGIRPMLYLDLTEESATDNISSSTDNAAQSPATTKVSNPLIIQDASMQSGQRVTWDCIWFGRYWQCDTNKDGVANQEDAKEPIKWRVLSVNGDDAFLIADKVLDYGAMSGNNWGESTMRSWLNGLSSDQNKEGVDCSSNSFMGDAFSKEEHEIILPVDQIGQGIDYIYLPDLNEVTAAEFGFTKKVETDELNKLYYSNDEARDTQYTDYALQGGSFSDEVVTRYIYTWMLRNDNSNSSSGIDIVEIGARGGSIWLASENSGSYSFIEEGVRPVMHLNISDKGLWSYAGTVCSDGTKEEITCSTATSFKDVYLGDVYQDDKIDGKDVSLLLQYRLKKRELTEEQIAAGDVYADGKIDGKDVSKLLQYRLGKIESLE